MYCWRSVSWCEGKIREKEKGEETQGALFALFLKIPEGVSDWNGKDIFKRNKNVNGKDIEEDSYCTRSYVQGVILRYCQD